MTRQSPVPPIPSPRNLCICCPSALHCLALSLPSSRLAWSYIASALMAEQGETQKQHIQCLVAPWTPLRRFRLPLCSPPPFYGPAIADLSTQRPLPTVLPPPPPAHPALPTLLHDAPSQSLLILMQYEVSSVRTISQGGSESTTHGLPWQPPFMALSKFQGHCLFTCVFSPRGGEVPETRDCGWRTVGSQEGFAKRWVKMFLVSLLEPSPGGPGGSWTRKEARHLLALGSQATEDELLRQAGVAGRTFITLLPRRTLVPAGPENPPSPHREPTENSHT